MSELLQSLFQHMFPGCGCGWKNSQGIFNSIDRCMTKRSICFSMEPISLSCMTWATAELKKSVRDTPAVWGLCGFNPTRGNKADEGCFFLCRQSEKNKHFRACAIIYLSPVAGDGMSIQLNSNEAEVERLLEVIKEMGTETCKVDE